MSDSKSTVSFPSMIIILSSLSTIYTFSTELKEHIFNIDGIPYCPPNTPGAREFLEEMKNLCYEKINEAVETNYSIIIINSTPLTLEVLKELKNKADSPNASNWLFLSLFHEDKDIMDNKVKATEIEYLDPRIILDVKQKDIKSLSDYPFIKQIIIPHNFQVDFSYLNNLFE